jgi:hypothetical protein
VTEELLARLNVLEAERDVLRNMYRYGHTIDVGDADGWLDCFTEDGIFQATSPRPDYPPFRVQGHAALREFIDQHTRPPGLRHKHLLIEPLIDVDGDQATARSYFAVIIDNGGRPTLRVFGYYEDQLQRGSDARWRFVDRHSFIDSFAEDLPPLAYGRERADAALAAAQAG